jgi:hypothetical protein
MKTLFTLLILCLLIVPASAQKRRAKKATARKAPIYRTVPVLVEQLPETQTVERAFAVGSGSYMWLVWNVTDDYQTFAGRFTAQGGSGNNIEIFIMDADGFTNYKNGNTAQTFYNSGRVTVGNFKVVLPRGVYYFVLNNKFSWLSSKAVQISFYQ